MQDFKPGQGEELPEPKKNYSPRASARAAALQALYQWHYNRTDMGAIIRQFVEEGRLKGLDSALFQELAGCVSQQAADLDELYEGFLDRHVSMIDPVEKNIMRIAVYELQHSMQIPYKVVINEAVELAKRFGAEESHKYVNGILDKVAKNLREVEFNPQSRSSD